MAYIGPYVDDAGMHIPTYNEIMEHLIGEYRRIYGNDIYLDEDSQDYQLVSAFALMIYDTNQGCLAAYNNMSTSFATGAALDRLVTLNGITRNGATFSTCNIVLTGTAGTVIKNGVVRDASGYYWDMPEEVTIGQGGTVTVTATCRTAGHILAPLHTLTTIATPTQGWVSVDNNEIGQIGAEEENDLSLRIRQNLSVAAPARTVFEGIIAAVAAVPGVVRYKGYENDTGSVVDGLPAHSVTIVVDCPTPAIGQAEKDSVEYKVAEAIYSHKTPGCYTNGTTMHEITDRYGAVNQIRFYHPDYTQNMTVSVVLGKLAGFTDETVGVIKQNIEDYINGYEIGESLYAVNLNAPILAALNGTPTFYVKSLTVKVGGVTKTVVDVAKHGCVYIDPANITVEAQA